MAVRDRKPNEYEVLKKENEERLVEPPAAPAPDRGQDVGVHRLDVLEQHGAGVLRADLAVEREEERIEGADLPYELRSDNAKLAAMNAEAQRAERLAVSPVSGFEHDDELDRGGGATPNQGPAAAGSSASASQRRDEVTDYEAGPTRPSSEADRDTQEVEHHFAAVEMTEAQRARYERLMEGDFQQTGREVTDHDAHGHDHDGRERGD